jgi:hypothetical protein
MQDLKIKNVLNNEIIDLFKDYNEINKLLNNEESKIKTFYYKNKILDNPTNEDILEHILLKRNEKNLMISQPGSGKTYSLLQMSNKLKRFTVLAVPNRHQAKQIEQEYKELNIKAIVGGVSLKPIEEEEHYILAVVADRLKEVLDTYKVDVLIVDEAQELVLATYRVCLNDIEDSFFRIEKDINVLNVIYLTATPNTLMYLHFKNVYEFKQEVKDVFPENYSMYYIKDINGLITKIIDNYKKGIKTLVRLNDKDKKRKRIETILRQKCSGIRIDHTSSLEKGYIVRKDGSIKYLNEMTDSVINKSCLPDCDVLFCTSILDKGINLNYIEGGDLEKLELIYVILNPSDCLIDNIIQFESRIRNKYFKFSIMVVEKEVKNFKFRDLKFITNRCYKDLLDSVKCFKYLISDYLEDGYSKEEVLIEVEEKLSYTTIDGLKASLNDSISINENLEIEINLKKFFRFVYLKYNKQLYNNPELIKKFFTKEFKNEYIISLNFDDVETDENELNEILEELKTNKYILKPSEFKEVSRGVFEDFRDKEEVHIEEELKPYFVEINTVDLTNEELEKEIKTLKDKHKKFSESWKSQEYYNLIELGKDETETIDLLKDSNQSQIGKIKNKIMIDYIKNEITKEDIKYLKNFLTDDEDDRIENLELKNKNLFVYRLRKTKCFDYFEECIAKHYDIEDMIDYIKKGGTPKQFLELKQYIKINNKYINNQKSRGLVEEEQYFIIKNIGEYENKDNVSLTKDKIDMITKKINKEFKKSYSNKDVEKTLNKIFKVGKNGRLNGLRLK